MELNNHLLENQNIEQLSNEFTYRRYLMNKVNVKKYFQELSVGDYIIMCMAQEAKEGGSCAKVYLEDIAERMQIPVYKVSRMIGVLKDRGLVEWTHDGDGSEGTYITITSAGVRMLKKQGQVLHEFYGRVIEKYGKEKFVHLLVMMNEVEEIMRKEIYRMKGEAKE